MLVCNTEAAWKGTGQLWANRATFRKHMPSKGNGVPRAAKHKVPAEEEEECLGSEGGRATAATVTTNVVQGIPS